MVATNPVDVKSVISIDRVVALKDKFELTYVIPKSDPAKLMLFILLET